MQIAASSSIEGGIRPKVGVRIGDEVAVGAGVEDGMGVSVGVEVLVATGTVSMAIALAAVVGVPDDDVLPGRLAKIPTQRQSRTITTVAIIRTVFFDLFRDGCG